MSLEDFAKKRFLIVDPLDSYCFATKKMLIDLGVKLVSTASSAQSVLSGIQNVDYDVILCNFELGEGKNGQELLEELRVKRLLKFSALFFIVTAEVARDKVLGTIENEPDGYLVKPLTPAELGKRLKISLQQKESFSDIDAAIDLADYAQALKLCNQRLAEKDRYTLLLFKTKAWLLSKLGEWNKAKALFEELLDKSEHPWARLGLAEILINQHEYETAEQHLKQIIEEDRDRIEAYDLLAKIKELQQDPHTAQEILERAVIQSPNSVRRQKALADMRIANDDQKGAIEAYRKVIKLGSQSIYAEPDHYFHFANVLAEASNGSARNRLGKEALDVLSRSKKRFADRDQIDLQSTLVEAQVQVSFGDLDTANSLLEQVQEKANLRKSPLNGESAVIAAKTLIKLGRGDEVDEFLQNAADQAAEAELDVSGIYNFMDDRISLQNRKKATELNKQGIRLHGENNLDGAIQAMLKAIPYTPHHISLNLNLLQLLVKKLKTENKPAELREKAEQCFHRVRHIPPDHKEYRRFAHLKKQYAGL